MRRRRLAELVGVLRPRRSALRSGQLDNRDLEVLLAGIIDRENWLGERPRIVIEVGTGGGKGSTVAIHRALAARRCRFRLFGYEGEPKLARQAARYWSNAKDVRVINEYFMHREDIDLEVKLRIEPGDRASYIPTFDAVARAENFLASTPPGPIDLLFIDSVRYTHLAILRAATPWLRSETVVVMEDDIPGYGELAIIESELKLRDVVAHNIEGHPWPLIEFKVAPDALPRLACKGRAGRRSAKRSRSPRNG